MQTRPSKATFREAFRSSFAYPRLSLCEGRGVPTGPDSKANGREVRLRRFLFASHKGARVKFANLQTALEAPPFGECLAFIKLI